MSEIEREEDKLLDDDIGENEMGNIFGDSVGHHLNDIVDPKQDPLLWVQTQIKSCVNPRIIIRELIPEIILPNDAPELSIWRLIFEIITEPAARQRLPNVSSLEDVMNLIKECKNIIVLTGAGVSVSCGIPDFRSRDGIYARLSEDFPDLPDPHSMFDIHFFHCNPLPFFKFAKEIYPGQFTPSLSHRFILQLEKTGKLLRNYTQNIDTLEQVAGIRNVVHCHGSFATATCMNCKCKVKAEDIKHDIFEQKIPFCKECTPNIEGRTNILKPDIVFFGEGLPDEFHKQIEKDKEKADLLIVIGSSLKVRPVALIPSLLKPYVPQILINRQPLQHMQFDVELYGNCDDVINELCNQLGAEWTHITESFKSTPVKQEKYKLNIIPSNVIDDSEQIGKKQSSFEVSHHDPKINYIDKIQDNYRSIIGNERGETSCLNNCSNCRPSNQNISDIPQNNSDSTYKHINSPISMKRKCICNGEGFSNIKRCKNSADEEELETSDIYYLPIPPNCYVFHGAELDSCSGSERDSTDDYCNNETDGESWKLPIIPSHTIIENETLTFKSTILPIDCKIDDCISSQK